MFIPSECLISLLSGINAQEAVKKDLLRAEQVGKASSRKIFRGKD